MGNGSKAQQKRDRKVLQKGQMGTSQKKANDAAKSIVCAICRHAFLITTRGPALQEHAENKHNSTVDQCFPNASGSPDPAPSTQTVVNKVKGNTAQRVSVI